MSLKKNNLIVQHNQLIQSCYKTTLQEKRLILWLMAQIKYKDQDFHKYTLKVSDFAKMIGLKNNHNIYSELEKITSNLLSKVMTIENKTDNTLTQLSFFSSSIYNYNKGTVAFSFDPALKPYLLELNKQYTAFSLNTVIQFTSFYAIRIYELLQQYKAIGQRRMSITELRRYLGIEDSQYKLYASFKTRIIKFAEKEINTKSDLYFDYKEEKEGRKVIAIEFFIRENTNVNNKETFIAKPVSSQNRVSDIKPKKPIIQGVVEELHNVWGVDRNTACVLVKDYPESVINNAIEFIKDKLLSKEIENPAAYLVKAIKNKWENKSSQEVQDDLYNKTINAHMKSSDNAIWQKTLEALLRKYGKATYISWFTRIKFKEYKHNTLFLVAKSAFIRDYLNENYINSISKSWNALEKQSYTKVEIELEQNR